MLVGIMSDSHDNVPALTAAIELFKNEAVQAVIHAGDIVAPFSAKVLAKFDGQIVVVYGNNDGEKAGLKKVLPGIEDPPVEVELGGKKFVVVHDIAKLEREPDCDVIVYGHSHELDIVDGKPMRINPGEVGGWLTQKRTVVILDTDTMKCRVHEVD